MATEKSFYELYPELAENEVEETETIETTEATKEKSFYELYPELAENETEETETTEATETTLLEDFDPRGADWGGAFVYGLDQPLENMGITLEALGAEGVGEWLREVVEAPENYESATEKFINMQGDEFQQSYLPRAVLEQGGQLVGSLLSRIGGAAIGGAVTANPLGAVVGAFAGPAIFEAIQILGPTVQERLVRDGREGEEPTWEDWTAAASASGVSGLLNAVGIKGLGNLNKHRNIAVAGAALKEGVTEGTQSLVQEVGSGAFTEEGLKPGDEIVRQMVGEGILGGTAAGSIQAGVSTYQKVTGINPPTFDQTKDALEAQIEKDAEAEILASNIENNNFEDLELDDIRRLITERGYETPVRASDTKESLQAKLNGFIKEDVQRKIYGEDAERNVLAPLREPAVRQQQLNYFNSLTEEELGEYIEQNIGLEEYQQWAANQGEFSFDSSVSGKENYQADRKALANANTAVSMAQMRLPSKFDWNQFNNHIDELSERYDLATLQGMAQTYGGLSQNQLNTYDKRGLATKIAEGMLTLENQQLKTAPEFLEKSTFVPTDIKDFGGYDQIPAPFLNLIKEDGNAISVVVDRSVNQGQTVIPLKFERLGAIQDPDLALEQKLNLDGNLILSNNQTTQAENYLNEEGNDFIKGKTTINEVLFRGNTRLSSLELPQGTLPRFDKEGLNRIFKLSSWFRPYGPIGFELGRRQRENITRTRALEKNSQQLAEEYDRAAQETIKESNGDLTREDIDKLGMAFLRRTGAKLKLDKEERAAIEAEIQKLNEEFRSEATEEGKSQIQNEINELKIDLEGIQKTAVAAQQLPKKMQAPLIKIRTSIDALSKRLLDLPIDLVPEEERVTIAEGINKYVTRSFALFEPGLGWNPRFSKKWLRNKEAQQLYERAIESVYQSNLKKGITKGNEKADRRMAAETIDQIISLDNLESSQDLAKLPGVFKSPEATIGLEKAQNVIKNRGVIPKAIRELMGEINDPAQVAATSLSRLSRLVEMTSFYDDIRQINERPGEMFFSPVRTGKYQFPIEKNDFNPLSGQFTTKEIAETLGMANDLPGSVQMILSFWDPIVLAPKAAIQMGMIVISPATQSRNFFGAGIMYLANGYLSSGNEINAYESIKQELFPEIAYIDGVLTLEGSENQKTFRRMQELGIVNTSVRLNDVADLFSKINASGRNNTLSKWSHNLQAIKQTDVGQKADLAAGSWLRGLKNVYAAVDDFWKMAAFSADKGQMKKMLNNMRTNEGEPFSDALKLKVLQEYASTLTTKLGTDYKSNLARTLKKSITLEEYIDEVSAYHVRMGMPNYDYVGKFAQVVRQLPFGNFIAFPTEILRTAFNLQQIAYKQATFKISPELMAEGNIKSEQTLIKNEDGSETLSQATGARPMTANGMRRYIMGAGAMTGLASSTAAVLQYIFDVDDEELDAIRIIGPEYGRNDKIAPLSKIEKGKGDVLNLNYLLPYEGIAKIGLTVMNSVREGESQNQGLPSSVVEGLAEWVMEYSSSYTDASIASKVQFELVRNESTTGRQIWNPRDPWGDVVLDMLSYIKDNAAPGAIPQITDIYRSLQEGDERYDKYLGDVEYATAQMKLLGFSTTEVDAEKSLPFVIGRYQKDIKNSLTYPLTQLSWTGESTQEEDVLYEYEKAQNNFFQIQQELYFVLQNFEKLDINQAELNRQLKRLINDPGVDKSFRANIKKGIFTPYRMPATVKRNFLKTKRELQKLEREAGRSASNIRRTWPTRDISNRRNKLARAKINLTAYRYLPEIE